jgi:hypothetical protein
MAYIMCELSSYGDMHCDGVFVGEVYSQGGRVDVYDGGALRAESVVHMNARHTLQ